MTAGQRGVFETRMTGVFFRCDVDLSVFSSHPNPTTPHRVTHLLRPIAYAHPTIVSL